MKKFIISLIIIIIVLAILFFGFRKKESKEEIKPVLEEEASLGQTIFEESAVNPVENLPETNPFESVETNPFRDGYKNPF